MGYFAHFFCCVHFSPISFSLQQCFNDCVVEQFEVQKPSNLGEILAKLKNCHQVRNGEYTADCPVPGHHTPERHLYITDAGDKALVTCFNRHSYKDICRALGYDNLSYKSAYGPRVGRYSGRRVTALYDYRDETGQLLFQVIRYEPKSFRQRRPDASGRWNWNLENSRRVVYRLPELLKASLQERVFIVEGEKAADALVEKGLLATCSPMGAGKWSNQYASVFANRDVVILPDNDEPGALHASKVAASLNTVAKSVKVLALSDLENKQDVFDWLGKGHNVAELVRLAGSTEAWQFQNGAALLDEIVIFIRRFLVLSLAQVEAIALWILHTYVIEAAEATPYLNLSSAEKRSGKTRTLELLDLLVARAWFTGRVTAAVLARKIDAECPTLLLDESDAAFKGDREYAETLRAILNSGYRRGGKTSVCVGQGAKISYVDLSTFCPKAIAGIGKLPDTVADRSIPITLKRRTPGELVDRFRRKKVQCEAAPIRARLIDWANSVELEKAEPALPEELDDRAADCWEPLLAIADAAGDEWPGKARKAAIELMTSESRVDESLGVRLLNDIRNLFDSKKSQITSADLVYLLKEIEDSPWGDLRGRPLDARHLAALLKPYGIRPSTIREGDKTPKGYRGQDFHDAFKRYLPSTGELAATSATPGTAHAQKERENIRNTEHEPERDVANESQARLSFNVADVAAKSQGINEKQIKWRIAI